jgi:hypothetical protein
MKQAEHLFQFSGRQVSEAAFAERDYHKERLEWWRAEQDAQVGMARALTAVVKVREAEVTGGRRYEVYADITGLQEISARLRECGGKIDSHRRMADEYHLKGSAYATQPDRAYELDPADVAYFRLAGGPRDD